MSKWEYLAVPLQEVKQLKKDSAGLPPSHLNELGAQGWETVGLCSGSAFSRPTWCFRCRWC
jgi:hypothetical protein